MMQNLITLYVALKGSMYIVFHGFGQAKFSDVGSVFRLKPIFNTAPAASKNDAQFKRGQN